MLVIKRFKYTVHSTKVSVSVIEGQMQRTNISVQLSLVKKGLKIKNV